MFVACDASLNGFILRYWKMLFIYGTHLSRPYERALMGAVTLNTDNHLFDVAYAIVSSENNNHLEWFLTVLCECLARMELFTMLGMHHSL